MVKKKKEGKSSKEELKELSLHYDLLELTDRLDIKVVKKSLEDSNGGLCRIKNQLYIFLNNIVSIKEQNKILVKEISSIDLSKIFIKPSLRKLISEKNND